MADGATTPEPNPGLKALEKLVGTWKITGGTEGEATYEWLPGGHFMLQRGEVVQNGETVNFLQVIGYDRAPGAPPGEEIVGRLYTNAGDTLTYVCEADEHSLTIWFGEKGSPAFYKGEWSDDGTTLEGEWTMPGDGGYKETMTRVK